MNTTEIVNEIITQNCVEEVFSIFFDILVNQRYDAKSNLAEARASLRAIHKINAGITKNEAIDVLGEV